MNIKIPHNDVLCLISNYDQVYYAISHQVKNQEIIFCKRVAGLGYLQWTLPEGDWMPLSKADESDRHQILDKFEQKQEEVRSVFRSNQALAQVVLTVPSEDYIFFRKDPHGDCSFAITGWGYKFPEKIFTLPPKRDPGKRIEKQIVKICFEYDGKNVPNQDFTLNSFKRTTDASGIFNVGELVVGESFPIGIDEKSFTATLVVEKGKELYAFDITEYVTIEIVVRLDDVPQSDKECLVKYNGRSEVLRTNGDGKASVEWPYDRYGAACTATINDQTKTSQVQQPKTIISFDFVTPPPVVEPPVDPPVTDGDQPPVVPPVTPPVVDQDKMVRFRLLGYKGMPLPELDFTIRTKSGEILHGTTDQDGYAEFPASHFKNGERPKIDFTISREYQERFDIYAKPKKK